MDNIIEYGTITPEKKEEIFYKYQACLTRLKYNFSVIYSHGTIDCASLECPELGLKLELNFPAKLSNSELMCYIKGETFSEAFMVNDLTYLLKKTDKIILSQRKKGSKRLYVPEEDPDYVPSDDDVKTVKM